MRDARRLIEQSSSIVTFSGAGLSAESGVPTFRDPQEGLWAHHDPMKLASPQGFAADPSLVIDWYAMRRRTVAAAQPNPAHRALASLTEATHITQNVDDLLERAGTRQVIHLHGTLSEDRCHSACGFRSGVEMADPPELTACPQCNSMLRPAVVWFGEQLPSGPWAEATAACQTAELLIVVGTSGTVYPAAGLVEVARTSGAATIVINRDPTPIAADASLIGKAGELLPLLLS